MHFEWRESKIYLEKRMKRQNNTNKKTIALHSHNFRRVVELLSFSHHNVTTFLFLLQKYTPKFSRLYLYICVVARFVLPPNYNLRNFPIIFKFMPRQRKDAKYIYVMEKNMNEQIHSFLVYVWIHRWVSVKNMFLLFVSVSVSFWVQK